MNESFDLRNRILKMRESNDLVLHTVKAESKTIDTDSKIILQNTEKNLNNREIDLENKLEKENFLHESKQIKNSINLKVKNDTDSNKQISDNLVYDNEAQFRIIAKKFNEAVEVILELSDKVKNLEETVHGSSVKSDKNRKSYFFLSLKNFVLIILTTCIVLGLFTFPIDLTLIKIIIKDVISSI